MVLLEAGQLIFHSKYSSSEICSWAKDCKYWDELAYTLICERIQQNIEFKLASKFEPCEEMNTITLKQNNEELISFGVYFDIC